MPGGCSRNAILRKPHPIYAAFGEGCYVTDIEGVKRIDFANNMASLIHGHAKSEIVEAICEQAKKGTAFALGTEVEIAYAEHMIARSGSFEKLRFVNSGTEAIMCCLKAARAYTGRPKVVKTEGAYHGVYDYAEISQTSKPDNWGALDSPKSNPVSFGTPQSALDDVIVIPFNDAKRAKSILDAHREQIACVLIDPMPHRIGVIPAKPDFVRSLREWTQANGALFLFDEVITFRSEYGGAQEWYDVKPDLTALGKMIGGGFPVGALAGRADIMDVMNPHGGKVLFPHSGTFSANPMTMTAGCSAMKLFDRDAVENLNKLGNYARSALRDAILAAKAPACVTGAGSMFRIHLREHPPQTYRDAYVGLDEKALLGELNRLLSDDGVILIDTCSGVLSTPMTTAELDRLSDAVCSALTALLPKIENLAA